ncbi:MAG: hypothetical protein RSE04_06040 [Hydrogenoanaerobacterium sp.]
MIKIKIGGSDFTPALAGEPTIQDQLNANCRILNFNVQQVKNPQRLVGYQAELYYGGVRWFTGEIKTHGIDATGNTSFKAYDPLFFLSKNPDDYYFKNQTATQILNTLAGKCNIKIASIANTGTVFPYLYYPGASPEKIAIDVLARTKDASGLKFWYRYDPVKDGLIVFERNIPGSLWAFQLGVNLLNASKTDSIEELCSTVKLVNRETGKVVVKTNAEAQARYGRTQYFEEVNNDIKDVDGKASSLLADLSKVTTTMNLSGVNPDGVMPQFFTGDAVYVEEPNTGMVGGYYIKNVTHTFKADNLIQIDADVESTPELPAIQFSGADKEK